MKLVEILILVLVVAYCAYVLFGKKKHSCCGNCSGCQGCAHKEEK